MVDKAFLFDVTLAPDAQLMGEIARKIEVNSRAFLRRFYADCFSPQDREGWEFFKAELMPDYLEQDKRSLIDGLGFLAQANLDVEALLSIAGLKIFHGAQDKVFDIKSLAYLQEHVGR